MIRWRNSENQRSERCRALRTKTAGFTIVVNGGVQTVMMHICTN